MPFLIIGIAISRIILMDFMSFSWSSSASIWKVNREIPPSPGEYLTGVSVSTAVKQLDKPSFLTSSKSEANQTKAIFDNIKSTDKTQFVPNGTGRHGASALWTSEVDNAEYWAAVKVFLKT